MGDTVECTDEVLRNNVEGRGKKVRECDRCLRQRMLGINLTVCVSAIQRTQSTGLSSGNDIMQPAYRFARNGRNFGFLCILLCDHSRPQEIIMLR